MKRMLIVGISAALLTLNAGMAKQVTVQQSLAAVPASELPAKAAELVKAANPTEREATTVSVVKRAMNLRPAAGIAVVGAIAKAAPEMASVAAGTAATAEPKQASAFAKVAATAAPAQAGKIVAAVSKAAPKQYQSVALAVVQAAPGSEKEVLRALGTVFARANIEQAIETYTANPASFSAVVASIGANSSTASTLAALPPNTAAGNARGPIVAPPYVPPSGTPANITPSTSGEVPSGGRDYAKP